MMPRAIAAAGAPLGTIQVLQFFAGFRVSF